MAGSSKAAAEWGGAQVVEVGWNVTDRGHYMKPSSRVRVEIGEGGELLVHYGRKPQALGEFLGELTSDDGPRRLCRVWLITDDQKQHCCWWYERDADGVNREMVEHFAANARRQAGSAPASTSRSPSP